MIQEKNKCSSVTNARESSRPVQKHDFRKKKSDVLQNYIVRDILYQRSSRK